MDARVRLWRWASTSSSGSDRSASSLQARSAVWSHNSGQLERQRRDVAGIQRQQPLRGRRRTGHRGVDDGQRGVLRGHAARRADRARRHRQVRRRRRARPSHRRATPGAPAASGRVPARGTPGGRREPVCGRRFRDRRPRSAARRCAPPRPPTPSPVPGWRFGDAGTPAASARSTTRPLVTASSTPPECTCPPVGSRESASASSVARLVIRTGNTVAPWAVRRRAAPARPRRRCAR